MRQTKQDIPHTSGHISQVELSWTKHEMPDLTAKAHNHLKKDIKGQVT